VARPKADFRRSSAGSIRVVQSEGFELLAPFCRSITKSLDSNTAWQTTFDRSAHEVWCEERK
jgi:hypothetical protein